LDESSSSIVPEKEMKFLKEDLLKAQQAILNNHRDALQDENYIIEFLNQTTTPIVYESK